MANDTYDFIVVGSGPSGCAVAAGLANAPKRPSVLLLEAGGDNAARELRVDGQRWMTMTTAGMNWGYKTSPQTQCGGRELDYSRGLGLGGSSAINFGVYSVGARDDYDEWARLVRDDAFSWAKMQPRFKALESFDRTLPQGVDAKYASPRAEDHGSQGPLKVGYAAEWEKDLTEMVDIFETGGWKVNPDHNSGDPLGMSVLINSAHKGVRSTAADLLTPKPDNLTIVTGVVVKRVLLDDSDDNNNNPRAVGVETLDGKRYLASKETILCAGALDTPKILMHSGIGPASQLNQYSIPVALDVPGVGQGLRDHMFVPLVYKRTPTSTSRASFYGDEAAMKSALEAWKRDGSGSWAKYACELGIGWAKLPSLEQSAEYKALPASEQRFLSRPTVPHYEVITHFPIHWFVPDFPADSLDYAAVIVFYYNAQARGEATLQSADPAVPLRFDPRFLDHEFDRRVAVESLRETLRVLEQESFTRDTVAQIAGPVAGGQQSDEELLGYWRETVGSSWHMTGTAKMGADGDNDDGVVDSGFRLKGVRGLRVADMSVVPVLASCHIQAVAYITGVTAAEKLVAEYGLGTAGQGV
ncbi:choline dehydrogenase [Microdochium nivale]|nr:choline dehydrogenase [Microdochium nivale]